MTSVENATKLQNLAEHLTDTALEWREEPFELRAGGLSQNYVDIRRGVSSGRVLAQAGELIVATAQLKEVDYNRVAGNGIAGRALMAATVIAGSIAAEARSRDFTPELARNSAQAIWANDNRNDTDSLNGYGLRGADVAGRKVLMVDDIGSTGSSLLTLAEMVRDEGGLVDTAINVCDRSEGRVAAAMADIGVAYYALTELDELNGVLVAAVEFEE